MKLRELWDTIRRQYEEFIQSLEDNETLKLLVRVVIIGVFILAIVWLGVSLSRIETFVLGTPTPMPPTPLITDTPVPTLTPTPGPSPTPAPTSTPTPPPESPVKVAGRYARYLILPFGAFMLVLLAAGRYVQDVYALRHFSHGMIYVINSLTGIFRPLLVIDKGKIQLREGEFNPIKEIGGPGYVVVQPGNAVLFRSLRRPSQVGLRHSVALSSFETIGEIVNLDDQHSFEPSLEAVTIDGIKVRLTDIQYRFRIISTRPRTLEEPYPFDEDAVNRMAYNRAVTAKGLPDWRMAVHNLVKSALTDYVNSKTIDYLTAPREDGQDPRQDMRTNMTSPGVRQMLRNIGAELAWIDVGHIDIVMPEVDEERVRYWASDWVGSAEITRAYGEAKRQAYMEIGRAEAQAELIMSIASALEGMENTPDAGKNLQYLLLSRTAQILDALHENGPDEPKKDENKPKG